jgi:hypothetical protein
MLEVKFEERVRILIRWREYISAEEVTKTLGEEAGKILVGLRDWKEDQWVKKYTLQNEDGELDRARGVFLLRDLGSD